MLDSSKILGGWGIFSLTRMIVFDEYMPETRSKKKNFPTPREIPDFKMNLQKKNVASLVLGKCKL